MAEIKYQYFCIGNGELVNIKSLMRIVILIQKNLAHKVEMQDSSEKM